MKERRGGAVEPPPWRGRGTGGGSRPLLMKERWERLEHPSHRLGPQKRRWDGVYSAWESKKICDFFCFPLAYSSFAASRRRYSRSGKQKNLRFFLLFARLFVLCRFAAKVLRSGKQKNLRFFLLSARLFVLCRSAAKVLTLGKAKKSAIFFAFRSLIRTFAP